MPRMILKRVGMKSGCRESSLSNTMVPCSLKLNLFFKQYSIHCITKGAVASEYYASAHELSIGLV